MMAVHLLEETDGKKSGTTPPSYGSSVAVLATRQLSALHCSFFCGSKVSKNCTYFVCVIMHLSCPLMKFRSLSELELHLFEIVWKFI
ncbi:hypothetical protein HanHA300_Chr01g0019461 [Helianthus annuus]|nr:hypothetical protein HanHA300_Chr01g0019461 [Helianthus annuus]